MLENVLATLLFWSAFAYSAGPFWAATMQYAVNHSFREIYENYVIYYFTGWFLLCGTIVLFTHYLSEVLEELTLWLHLFGPISILYIAYKVYRSNLNLEKVVDFDFNWKNMSLLSWGNPKCWLLVPVGAVKAQYTLIVPLDAMIYPLLGFPLFMIGVAFWGYLGRMGAKISVRAIGYFNIILLLAFALLLEYEGWIMLQEKYNFSIF